MYTHVLAITLVVSRHCAQLGVSKNLVRLHSQMALESPPIAGRCNSDCIGFDASGRLD